MQLLAERFKLATGELLVQLPAGYQPPQVRVTTTEPELASTASGESRRPDLDELVEQARGAAANHAGEIPASIAAIPPDRSARRGFSFSRLSGELKRTPMPDEIDSFAEGEVEPSTQIDAKGLGTLVHEVLASWDWSTNADVERAVRRHSGRHLADDGDAEPADAISMVSQFVKSSRAKELQQARQLHREIEFLIAWPPARPQPGGQYLHGVIDCLYQDPLGSWHLLDYKTNKVSQANLAGVAEVYEMQMLIYAWAAEQVLAVAPTSLTLHFLRTGLEYAFTWSDAARRRAVELVEQAIAEKVGGGQPAASGDG